MSDPQDKDRWREAPARQSERTRKLKGEKSVHMGPNEETLSIGLNGSGDWSLLARGKGKGHKPKVGLMHRKSSAVATVDRCTLPQIFPGQFEDIEGSVQDDFSEASRRSEELKI